MKNLGRRSTNFVWATPSLNSSHYFWTSDPTFLIPLSWLILSKILTSRNYFEHFPQNPWKSGISLAVTFCHCIQNNCCSNLGVKVDENSRKISGAKALMLPYALKHSTKAEDKLAEVFDIKYKLYQNSKKPSTIIVQVI